MTVCTPTAPLSRDRHRPEPRPGRRRLHELRLEILGSRVGPHGGLEDRPPPLDRFQRLGGWAVARREGHPIEHLGSGPLALEPAVGGIGLGQHTKEIPRSSHRCQCVIVPPDTREGDCEGPETRRSDCRISASAGFSRDRASNSAKPRRSTASASSIESSCRVSSPTSK